MGAYNTIDDVEWKCPFCRNVQRNEIQFKYGPCRLYHYRIGDKIDWSKPGYRARKPLPNGTGIIRGNTMCNKDRHQALRESFGFVPRTTDLPLVLEVNIELKGDVIQRLFFDEDPDEVLGFAGMWNGISAEWVCPFCNTKNDHVSFRYGPVNGYKYKIGDQIDWNRPGYKKHFNRLPNGSGVVDGRARCKNNWHQKWQKQHIVDFRQPGGVKKQWIDLSNEERMAYGCPLEMQINIALENDVLKRVFFAKDRNKLAPGDW